MSDDELLAMARQEDGDAFGALFARHAGGARRYAAYLSRQILRRDHSDDVTAEAVRKTFSAIQRGHGPAISFRHYLRTAIRSVTMEMSTIAYREVRLDDVPDQEAPAADESLDAVLGMQAFRSLPPRWQQALWTDAVEQIPPREVAPMLGTTPRSVAVMTFRAREAFRIAYVRAHMPYAANDRCRVALDLIARGEVVELSGRQQRVLSAHLESCCGCRHAQVSIDDATNGWADEGWSPNDSDSGDDLAAASA
jgi:DNA-directed RNA polymerase specialized sigma24 family protein